MHSPSGPQLPYRHSFEGRPSASKQSGTKVFSIVGGGCAALLIVAALVAVIVFTVGYVDSATTSAPTAAPVAARTSVRDLREIAQPNGAAFVADVYNVGTTAIGPVRARLRLLDTAKREVSSIACAPPVRLLPANEKLPCAFVFAGNRASFESYDVVVEADPAPRVETAVVVATSTTMRRAMANHVVEGTLTNQSAFTARSVAVVVGLYGGDGKIVGAGTFVAPREIAPSTTLLFSAVVTQVAGPPRTFATRVVGYRQ